MAAATVTLPSRRCSGRRRVRVEGLEGVLLGGVVGVELRFGVLIAAERGPVALARVALDGAAGRLSARAVALDRAAGAVALAGVLLGHSDSGCTFGRVLRVGGAFRVLVHAPTVRAVERGTEGVDISSRPFAGKGPGILWPGGNMTDQPWLLQSPPAPARRTPNADRRDIHSFTWVVWPWVNWLLPVLAIFCIGNNGWALLALLLFSPVLVPAAGLLGSLPRFLLRRSGSTTTPGPITVLLFVQWWAVITGMITPAGATDGRPIPAIMQGLSPRPISSAYLSDVMLVAAGIVVACWIAVLAIASVTASRKHVWASKRWTVVAGVAAVGLPLLFVATAWLGGAVTAQQRDAAGATVAEVQAQPLSSQAQQALERHDRAQAQLSLVRGMIAGDGWQASMRGFGDLTTFAEGADSYGVDIAFRYDVPAGDAVDVDAVVAELRQRGWTDGERGALLDPDGNTIEIDAYDQTIVVSLVSPRWWGDSDDLNEELGVYHDDSAAEPYAYDDWPSP
jgi:hypothetical protein